MPPTIRALLRELTAAEKRVEELQDQIGALKVAAPPLRPAKSRPRRDGCQHKTSRDHITGRTSEGRAVWRCSECGAEDTWESGWMYHGNIECRKCQEAAIDRVLCPTCSQGLSAESDP